MQSLFRPGDRSFLTAINIILGAVILVLSLLRNPGGEAMIFTTLGAMFLIGGVAEWLPANLRRISGGLRILGIGCALMILALAFLR